MENYKGYFICGSAVPTYMTGGKSKSLDIVLKSGRLGSVIEVKRIEGTELRRQAGSRGHIDVMLVSVCSRYALGDKFRKKRSGERDAANW